MASKPPRERAEEIYSDDILSVAYFSHPPRLLAKQVRPTWWARIRERKLRGVPQETLEGRQQLATTLQQVASERLDQAASEVARVIAKDPLCCLDYLDDPITALGGFMPWTRVNGRRPLDQAGRPESQPLQARLTMAVVPPILVPGLRATLAHANVEADETLSVREKLSEATESEFKKNRTLHDLGDAYRKKRKGFSNAARMIALHPKLRAEYFANPGKVLGRYVPPEWGGPRLWRFLRRGVGTLLEMLPGWVSEDTISQRRKLAVEVEQQINLDGRLISARETFHERESFLKEGMQNPEKSFRAVFWMSIVAFGVGIALLVTGAVAAALDHTLAAAVAGGAGLVATLTTVLTASSTEIRKINGDHAQIRMILTDFASEITHLRGIRIGDFIEAKERNAELRQLTRDSVNLVAAQTAPLTTNGKATNHQNGRRNGSASGSPDGNQGFLRRLVTSARRQTSL